LGGDELDENHLSTNLITNGRPALDPGWLQVAVVLSASSEVAVILLIFGGRHKGLPLDRELDAISVDPYLKCTTSSAPGYKVNDGCECSIRQSRSAFRRSKERGGKLKKYYPRFSGEWRKI